MNHSTILQELLQEHLPWHKSRVNFAARFVMALIKMGCVNFTQLALVLNPSVALGSNYRRLQRFFNGFTVDRVTFTQLVMALLPQQKPLILTLDRTMWRFGSRYHNVLMVAACADGIAIPLLWRMLPKEGCSNTQTRIDLMEELFQVLDPASVRCLVADREFIGKAWFAYLKKRKIGFVIRVRSFFYISTRKGRRIRGKHMFAHLRPGEVLALRKRRFLYGHRLFVCAVAPSKGDDMVILVGSEETHRALAFYGKRWQIETLFAALKSRGFNLESTHLTDKERVSKLIGLLSIAFTWAYRVGQWLDREVKPIAIKSHGRRAQSVFRYGLDHLKVIILNHTPNDRRFRQLINFLSCT